MNDEKELAEADMKEADENRLRWAIEIAERIQVDMRANPDYGVAQAAETVSQAIKELQYGGLLQAIEARGEIVDLTKKGEALCRQNGELLMEQARLRTALEDVKEFCPYDCTCENCRVANKALKEIGTDG